MPRKRILVVDDEPNARAGLALLLRMAGYEVDTAADAFKAVAKYEQLQADAVVTDLRMPGMDGIELVTKLRQYDNPPAIVVMTAFADVSSAIEAMHAGASEYLMKPLDVDVLLAHLLRLLESRANRAPASELHARVTARHIIAGSHSMDPVFEMIAQVAPSRATVLITGESGTGKELVADALHRASPRASAPFIKVHCAALAETLLESELFGHERGAFTGAIARKDGRFQLANGGTLFLDEIGEVSPSIQVKLLRFLQEHEFERVGGTQTMHVDVRVIAATHRNLADRISQGLFREDLYYRLNVVSLAIPSLRDRRDDIPVLVNYFIERFARTNDKQITGVSPAAMDLLVSHDWPGNVRELENAIERAVVVTQGTIVEARALPPHVRPSSDRGMPVIPGASLADIERYAILETLKSTGGSKSRAAEILGICARTIHYRLHEYRNAPQSGVEVLRGIDDLSVRAQSAGK